MICQSSVRSIRGGFSLRLGMAGLSPKLCETERNVVCTSYALAASFGKRTVPSSLPNDGKHHLAGPVLAMETSSGLLTVGCRVGSRGCLNHKTCCTMAVECA